MEIQVLKLRNLLGLLDSVVPRKPKIEILKCVLLKDGQIIATDFEKALALELPEVEGQILLPFQEVTKLLKYVPGNEMVRIEHDTGKVVLTWSGGKAAYTAMPLEDYPALPRLDSVEITQAIPGDLFVAGLLSVVGYCSNDETKPVLTGVSVLLGEQIDVMGTDGFRLAFKTLPIPILPVGDTKSVIIPRGTVHLLGDLWRRVPKPDNNGDSLIAAIMPKTLIELEVEATRLKMQFGIVTLYSQRITGTTPNFHQLIPDYADSVQVYGPDLERALRRVQSPAKAENSIVRLTWEGGEMTVAAQSEKAGTVEAKIPAQTFNDPGKIAIHFNNLMEYAQGKTGLITMCVKDHKSPLRLRFLNTPTVVIMPMFVSWPGEAPPPAPAPASNSTDAPSDQAAESGDELPEEGGAAPEEDGEGMPADEGNEVTAPAGAEAA